MTVLNNNPSFKKILDKFKGKDITNKEDRKYFKKCVKLLEEDRNATLPSPPKSKSGLAP